MKLASLRDGTPDGRLIVVARDLTSAAIVPHARTLQFALDHWDESLAEMEALSDRLNAGHVRGTLGFDQRECLSPLPRAYQWADGSAYLNHLALVRRARDADLPASLLTDPLIYQGGSDAFLAPYEDIPLVDESWGCDLEAEVAVVTGEVAMGASADEALRSVRLVMLANDVSLRRLVPAELAKGFGFYQSKPASAFSPCAVTPDELGSAWDGRRLHGRIRSFIDGVLIGDPDAGQGMHFDFGQLIAHAARTRRLGSGSVIGSGTVSNAGADGGPGRPIGQGGRGYSCLAELRAVETLLLGEARTSFLRWGQTVRIEMTDQENRSIFGAIEQRVARVGS